MPDGDAARVERTSATSIRRIVVVGALALVAPLAIGVLIAEAQPSHQFHVKGFGPFILVWLLLAGFAGSAKAFPLEDAVVVHLRSVGIASWRAEDETSIPNQCFPGGLREAFPGQIKTSVTDIRQGCWVTSAQVIVGVAPAGTVKIEG